MGENTQKFRKNREKENWRILEKNKDEKKTRKKWWVINKNGQKWEKLKKKMPKYFTKNNSRNKMAKIKRKGAKF